MPAPATTAAAAIPIGQTFGGASLGVNPTAVESSVDSYTGALETSHTDIRVAGIGVPFVLDRQYNSGDVAFTGAFGPGWSSILDLGVRFSSTGARAVVYGADGQQVGFTYQGSSKSWLRDPGVRASLVCSGPATNGKPPTSCTVKSFADGSYWTLTSGYVQGYYAADGQGLKFAYDSSHRINAITVDTTALTPLVVHLTRNSSGRVTKLATPTRSVSYSYSSAGDLATVTDPAGYSWRMTYQSGHLLDKVAVYASSSATSGTTTLTAAYNTTTKRATSVTEDNGAQMHNTIFTWTPGSTAGSGTAGREELVDESSTGNQRVTYTDSYQNGTILKLTQPIGHTDDTWNADLDLVQVFNPLGSTDTMTYDSAGDELTDSQTLDSAGDTSKTTYAYDSSHRMISASKVITSSLTDTATYTYNSLSELASSTVSGSGTTAYTYTGRGLLASKKDAAGNVTSYAYDTAGNLAGESVKQASGATPEGNGPLYKYDEAGDKVLSVPPVGNHGGGSYADATTMTYSADGQETSVTTPGGAVSSTTYAPDGQVTSSTDAAGNKTTYTWSAITQPGYLAEQKTTSGPAGKTVDVYDPSGHVISSTPPQPASTVSGKPSGVVTNKFNADGQIVSTTNGQGVTTTYTRDAAGDVLSTASRGSTTTATYNLVGWATGTSTTTRSYPTSESTSGGSWTADTTTTKTTYDAAGDVLSKKDAAGGTTSYTYIAGDRAGSVANESGTTTYAYNNLGDKTSVTSAGGSVTSYAYDGLGRETKQTIGSQGWTIAYDADGNPTQTVDPDGRTATYTYDASNRKTGVTYSWASGHTGAQAGPVQWLYNKLGERTAMIDSANGPGANGTTHFYTYDNRGRLVQEDTEQNGCSFNCKSSIFKYNYSTPDQLVETYPDGAVVTYKTDDGGNLMSLSVPAQSDGSPAFKTTSSLPNTLVTQGSSSAASSGTSSNANTSMMPSGTLYPDGEFGYLFNEPGKTTLGSHPTFATGDALYTASMANSASASNPSPPQGAYEAQSDYNGNLLEELWDTLPTSGSVTSTMHQFYGYNGGTVDAPVSEPSGSATAGVRLTSYNADYTLSNTLTTYGAIGSYKYNAAGQPTSITAESEISSPTSQTTVSWTLGYNSGGEIDSVSTTAPNPSNTPSSGPQFAYDAAGDLTSADVEPPYQNLTQAGKQLTFAYNDAGQLASATQVGGDTLTYSYDGDGNLAVETDTRGGATVENIDLTWDPRLTSPQLAEADFNGVFHERYFWGNGPLGMEQGTDGAGNAKAYVFHDNQAGTPTMITNPSGQTVDSIFDDPYGNYVNGTQSPFYFAAELIGFDGSYTDPLTGLDLMGSRWYDPNLGLFMSRSTATAPSTGSSSATSGASSTMSEGMSASPGTSPSMPVTPAATSYVFGADDPTGEAQPTGTTLAPAATGTTFAGTSGSDSSASIYSTVKPFVSGPLAAVLVKSPAQLAYKAFTGELSQTPSAAAESAAATEGAVEGGITAEDATLGSQAGNEAADLTGPAAADATAAADSAGGLGLGSIVSVGAFAFSAYEAGQTCANYGAGSLQCVGAALGTAISFGAQAACEAVTAGVGTVACGIVQSVLSAVIPLIVTGNGQAFLDSVTFGSGFNIDNAEVLAAQAVIAYALGPIGAVALVGEAIYANWSSIESGLVTAGEAIASALETAGTTIIDGLEVAGGAVVSGISTAAEEISSGFSALVSAFDSLDFSALGDAFSSLGNDAAYVADEIGSALCSFVSSIDCLFSGAFARSAQERAARSGASPGQPPPGGGGSRGPRASHQVQRLKPLSLSRSQGSTARVPGLPLTLPRAGLPALSP